MSEKVLHFTVLVNMDTSNLDAMIGGVDKWVGKTRAVIQFAYAAHPMKINSCLGYFAFKLYTMGLHVSNREIDLSEPLPKGIISIEENANPQPLPNQWVHIH